jgi:hypothetical protein
MKSSAGLGIKNCRVQRRPSLDDFLPFPLFLFHLQNTASQNNIHITDGSLDQLSKSRLFSRCAKKNAPIAGHLNLKARYEPAENSGISSGHI